MSIHAGKRRRYFVGDLRRAKIQMTPSKNAIAALRAPAPAWRDRKAIPNRKSARRMTRIFSKRTRIASSAPIGSVDRFVVILRLVRLEMELRELLENETLKPC